MTTMYLELMFLLASGVLLSLLLWVVLDGWFHKVPKYRQLIEAVDATTEDVK